MKRLVSVALKSLVSIALVGLVSSNGYGFDFGKIIDNSINRTDKKAENKVENKIDKGVDSAFQGVEGLFSGKKVQEKEQSAAVEVNKEATQASATSAGTLQWNSYDFVSGDEVIFEDDLKGERNGEFPSKWDLNKGNIENVTLDGENVIAFFKCNTNNGGGIVPFLKNSDKDYLPDEFTVEFDAFFEQGNSGTYKLYLADVKRHKNLDKATKYDKKWIRFGRNGVEYEREIDRKYYPGTNASSEQKAMWRHFALSFNKRALKVYLDDARLLNLPSLDYNPTGLGIGFHNPSGGVKGYIKNIRIAQGAVPLYSKVIGNGKIVTTGIRFEVNQAVIKPESMGIINGIVALMVQDSNLNFSIEGHTDSDGDASMNQVLSERRAAAVKEKFVELGIEGSRLKTAGWGESKPLNTNATLEEKVNNRRVEFIKY